jgi:hypothetical protein
VSEREMTENPCKSLFGPKETTFRELLADLRLYDTLLMADVPFAQPTYFVADCQRGHFGWFRFRISG